MNKAGGKKYGQKFKSMITIQYLLKNSDAEHAVNSESIRTHLLNYDIEAERHSISRDITDFLEVLNLEYENEVDEDVSLGYEIEYDHKLHGYKVTHRPYDFNDLLLLVDCINSAKFISDRQEGYLIDVLRGLCSKYEAERLDRANVFTANRVKAKNKHIQESIDAINEAIKADSKISFKYLKYTITDKENPIEKRNEPYIVSPFKLLINEGNYYLLAFTDEKQGIRTFRIDRMKDVKPLAKIREGEAEFKAIKLENYTKRVFSMFGGEEKHITIQFTMSKLDTVIDRFGTGSDVFYMPIDKHHFKIITDVEISDAFFAWLAGFRSSAVLLDPSEVITKYKKFLADISKKYPD